MIKLLVVAALIAVSVADENGENEKSSQTYLRPEYIRPHEPYHKHKLHHHRRDHEDVRHRHHYAGDIYHKEGYRGLNHHGYHHEEDIPHHPYNPYLERKHEVDHLYAHPMPIVYNEPQYYVPHIQHSPLHKLEHTSYNGYGHGYGYVPIKEAYHNNISPYLERRVDHKYPSYGYDYGNRHYGYGYVRN